MWSRVAQTKNSGYFIHAFNLVPSIFRAEASGGSDVDLDASSERRRERRRQRATGLQGYAQITILAAVGRPTESEILQAHHLQGKGEKESKLFNSSNNHLVGRHCTKKNVHKKPRAEMEVACGC